LIPAVWANFQSIAQEYFAQKGGKLQVNSAFRSLAEQKRLFETMPKGKASRPGKSMHNYGYSIDINRGPAGFLASSGLLDKYGFTRPYSSEPWHIEPKSLDYASIRKGIEPELGVIKAQKGAVVQRPTHALVGETEPEIIAPVRSILNSQKALVGETIRSFMSDSGLAEAINAMGPGSGRQITGKPPITAQIINSLEDINKQQLDVQKAILDVLKQQTPSMGKIEKSSSSLKGKTSSGSHLIAMPQNGFIS